MIIERERKWKELGELDRLKNKEDENEKKEKEEYGEGSLSIGNGGSHLHDY